MAIRTAGRDPVYRITDARRRLSEEQSSRVRRYVLSMSFRAVAFPAAILLHGWLRWSLVLAAVFIPYLAVVFANGGREPAPGRAETFLDDAQRQLPPGD